LGEEVRKETWREMSRKTKNLIIRLSAYSAIFVGTLISFMSVLVALIFSVSVKNLNVAKLFFVDFILILIAIVVFLLFLGLYEFFISFHKFEEELIEIEEKISKQRAKNEQ
jgi:uncharacterized membrane protein YqhA